MKWFEVSKEGLKELQLRKPKHFVARELIQNAWDEDIQVCRFDSEWNNGVAEISVEDDSPIGFRNITDAFTLFAPTYKREDPEKRGRFNIGEKQALAVCDSARVETTKGTINFSKEGRTESRTKRERGSKISLCLKMKKSEYDEMLEIVRNYLVPKNIGFLVNEEQILYREPYKVIRTSLQTEIKEGEVLKKTLRMTDVHILKAEKEVSYLYEMGIPVSEIECQFDIDVQQKVPLSMDRDSVSFSFLAALYAEVANETFNDITPENSSEDWIRIATGSKRITKEALSVILDKRLGDKKVIANPFDPVSVDDAIAAGYNVVTGSELSKEEWQNVKQNEIMQTSTNLFGSSTAISFGYTPNDNMQKFGELTKRIAKKCLGIDITVSFAEWDGSTAAQYGNKRMTVNVQALKKSFFDPPLSIKTLNLIIHELGHEKGRHTEIGYHEALTKIASELVMIALEDKKFFEI